MATHSYLVEHFLRLLEAKGIVEAGQASGKARIPYLVRLLVATGLRLEEACAVRYSDLSVFRSR